MTKYTIAYTKEEEDGGLSGRCLELPGAISQGETFEELKANMDDAINLVLPSIKEEEQKRKENMSQGADKYDDV